MNGTILQLRSIALPRWLRCTLLIAAGAAIFQTSHAQDTPLISGGVGFFSSTNGGNTNYLPIIEPLIAAPIGNHLMIESRAAVLQSYFPRGNGQAGYDHVYQAALTYLQGDFIVSPHLTVVAGSYLVPFGTYNERLSPLWINNLQDGPLIASFPVVATGTGLGGMVRGSAISRSKFSIDYAAFFSARSSLEQFNTRRSTGARANVYLPDQRLEFGFSYARMLQRTDENFLTAHAWWDPAGTAFRLRSEYGRGEHAHGYWLEADYRTQAFGGLDSWVGRIEPVLRMQQSFRLDNRSSDGLPSTDTKRPELGIDYNLPHNVRILTSYSRQLSATGNNNIWETGITYRFLFPAWKGK